MSHDDHRWFRLRLAGHAAGLLDETEMKRFLEHRAQCEPCRQAFDEFTTSDEAALTERGAHVPAAMLARWPQARQELRGLERAMVREHLKRCAECRLDLERLGHAPELEFAANLEKPGASPSWWARFRTPHSGQDGDHDGASRRVWLPWAIGGWATAATATALVLAIRPGAEPPRKLSAVLPSDVIATAPTGTSPAPTAAWVERLATARLRTPSRSTGEQVAQVPIFPDTRYVRLRVNPLDLPEGRDLRAQVLRGDERVAERWLGPPGDDGISLLLGDSSRPLPPGDYTLRLTTQPGSASERADTVDLAFRLTRTGP